MADIYQDIEAQIPHLRRYARALTRDVVAADDLVQECLVRALAKLHLWQAGTNLRAWLFSILHNQNVNQVRRAVRTGATVELSDAEPRLHRTASQEVGLELRDLDRALGRLPEGQRAVILMIGLEGMPYGDVAEVLGIPVGTVRSRLSRGRDALRRMMGAEPDQHTERAPTGILAANGHRQPRPAGALSLSSVEPQPQLNAGSRYSVSPRQPILGRA
jgi:RNA polymerase sigma-70 factor (ECF subfamily)